MNQRRELAHQASIISPYRFHLFDLANALAQQGHLSELVTAMPSLSIPEVPQDLVRSRPRVAVIRAVAQRLGLDSRWLNSRVVCDFESWVTSSVSISAPNVIVHSGMATRAIAPLLAEGCDVYVDRGSTHAVHQESVLKSESALLGLKKYSVDPWMLARELLEYEVATRIVVPSEQAAMTFVRHGVSLDRIVVVRYGVDTRLYCPPREAPTDRFQRVLVVAQQAARKGLHYLPRASTIARRTSVSFFMVGSPPSREYARALRRIGNLTDWQYLGSVSRQRVGALMQSCGIFVLPSLEEGLSLALLQAMASGMAVIATPETGASDVVRHGHNGLIIPSRDETALRNAIALLLDDPGLAQRLGDMARATTLRQSTRLSYASRYVTALGIGESGSP